MPNEIRITKNQLPAIAARLPQRRDQITRKTAFDVLGGFQQRSPVDTGAQKNSGYVVTATSSTYDAAASAAHSANPAAETLPALALPDRADAIVAVAAAYAATNELGGAHHRAQPALTPAAEAARAAYVIAMQHILDEV